jgi:peptidoglycan/LPS O-acetylase OafA/YrhL
MRLGYVPALDGLRGLAVLLVLVAHFVGILGGSLGVDLFFCLSGFLITTLLLEEFDHSGRVSLRTFYVRRARRLLPALVVLLVVCLAASTIEGHRQFAVAAMTGLYTGNIVQAFWQPVSVAGSGLAHLWTLAEEEQFYLLWPVMLVAIAARRRPAVWIGGLIAILVAYRIGLAAGGANHVRL